MKRKITLVVTLAKILQNFFVVVVLVCHGISLLVAGVKKKSSCLCNNVDLECIMGRLCLSDRPDVIYH